jgi:hypothetical protein
MQEIMNSKRLRLAPAMRTMVAIANISVLCARAFAEPVQAQSLSPDASMLSATDALARAQRTADRVKEFIVMNSKFDAVPASDARLAARPAARQASGGARPVTRTTTTRVASLPPVQGMGSAQVDVVRPAATLMPAPAAGPSPSGVEGSPPLTAAAAASLFDFEASTEGFSLHSPAEWAELPAKGLTLTPQAAHGQSALQAISPTDAWLGVDLSDAVDFSALKHLTFWMHSARGAAGRLAIKSGVEYDWCELRPIAIGNANGFVHYEVSLQAKGHECKNLDLEDIRGLQWFVRAGDTVVLDDVELR